MQDSIKNLLVRKQMMFFNEKFDNSIIRLKEKFPNFLEKYLKIQQLMSLKQIYICTLHMKQLANKYMDFLVMDITFGTNRFRMKH